MTWHGLWKKNETKLLRFKPFMSIIEEWVERKKVYHNGGILRTYLVTLKKRSVNFYWDLVISFCLVSQQCLGVRSSWGLTRYFLTWRRRFNFGFHIPAVDFVFRRAVFCTFFSLEDNVSKKEKKIQTCHANRDEATSVRGPLIVSFSVSYRDLCNNAKRVCERLVIISRFSPQTRLQ